MSMEQLNTYLATNSYLGSTACATLADYKKCGEVSGVDAAKFPHLARWHSHVSYLATTYPKFDHFGVAVPAGQMPKFDGEVKASGSDKKGAAAAPKKDAGKQEKEAAPKKEAASKKDKKGGDKAADPAPDAPEDPEKARKDKLKKAIKEGGKRGVEIEGAADMGGLQFFCTSVDLPEGDLEILVESVKAMNVKSDPTEEERKGGSGHIGKMVFSAGTEQLAVVAFVPEDKQKELSSEEWLKTVLDAFGGKIIKGDKEMSTGAVKTDSDKNVFPLKIREPMILEANNFLRKKGLFPEDNGDDDDDYVFGDDDFPSM